MQGWRLHALHRFPPTHWADYFPRTASLRIALSRVRSASTFRNCAFSRSSSLRRFACPPYLCRALGGTDQRYYRWRKEYGGMGTEQAKRLKLLERENAQLRKVLADLTLDNAILKEAVRGK